MRKSPILILSAVFLVFTLSGCATHEAKIKETGATLLTQSDLEALLSKTQTFRFTTPEVSGTTTYNPDRTISVDYGKGSDIGKYWFENGMVCSKYKQIRGGAERCGKWYKVSNNEYHVVSTTGALQAKVYLK